MSTYEYLSTGKYYDLSRLEKLGNEWDLGIRSNIQYEIDVLYINLKFLDMFLSLQGFTTVCRDATQKVQALFPCAEAEFKKINYPGDVCPVCYKFEEQIRDAKLEIRAKYPYSGDVCPVCYKFEDQIRDAKLEIRSKYSYPGDVCPVCYKFEEQIRVAKLEIRAKYSFPEASLPLSSNFATPEFVKRFIDSVVRNLSDLLEICDPDISPRSPLVPSSSIQQMEKVVKELKLLKNFVYFTSGRCTNRQSQHTFFTHVLVVAGHAAMISWLNWPNHWKEKDLDSAKVNASFSDLQMRIQPIQPCIRKIYIDVLQALKAGWHPNTQDEDVANYKAGFVETLVHLLEELPIPNKHKEIVAFKERIAMLNYLRETLDDFDIAIIKVGLLVYWMYDSVEEKEDVAVGELNQVTVLDFSGDIQCIQALIYFLTRKSFHSGLPKIDGMGSIDIILDNLKEFLSCYSDSLSCIKNQLRTIQQQLEHIQNQHDRFKSFGMQVISKAYEVEHIVYSCLNKDTPEWYLDHWTGDIIEEITLLMREAKEIHEKKASDSVLHNTTDVASARTSQFDRITSMSEEMVGFDEVVNKLKRQLIRGSSELDVISIVGMPGLGKTTLASKLYHDHDVVFHFDLRAQCCVSQAYTRKDLLLTILRGVKKGIPVSDKLPEDVLADDLRKILLVQRYLILIDDVWDPNAWDALESCFRDAKKGSRIILTTRVGDVASHAKRVSHPHFLRLFTPEESWMLLKNKVFNKKSCPLVLEDIGKKIAQKCGGLPLSVILVAGILETMAKEKHCWEEVEINLGPHIQAKSEDIINLSYQDLPFHLKPCFLYFGIFLEDEEIQVSKLTWLWTAEGLVRARTEMLSEDVAESYLENLIGRNLVMVSKRSSDGKTKACRIHDLLLDFCKKKAKVENFLRYIRGDSDMSLFIQSQKHSAPLRLCLYFQGDNLAEWSSICPKVQSFHLMKGRQIASSIGCASYTFNSFKYLRVLDLEFTVIDSFPEALTSLRYAAVRIAEDSSLSFSSNLWNLETLIVKGFGGRVVLPDTLWKMVKLRHLHIYNHAIFTIPNVQVLLDSPPKMDNLRTLASAWFSCVEDADNILKKTPNLQKLRCEVLKHDVSSPAFNNLTKLEMLKFSCGPGGAYPIELKLPPSLTKLTLSNGRVSSLGQVATLPRLVVLKLLQVSIDSKVWEDEQFPHLKILKLQNLSFSEWNVSDDAFPCLEHLVLRRLKHLEEIPSSFADVLTLKSIEVMACKESLVESAKDIRETQEEMQNSNFKLFIQK